MRYKDDIQCAGSELVAMVREDARKADPAGGGVFYALHVRRGDFQYKASTFREYSYFNSILFIFC